MIKKENQKKIKENGHNKEEMIMPSQEKVDKQMGLSAKQPEISIDGKVRKTACCDCDKLNKVPADGGFSYSCEEECFDSTGTAPNPCDKFKPKD